MLTAHILFQVRNEIAVLKRVSSGHPNIVTLHDYFEVCLQFTSYLGFTTMDCRLLTIYICASTFAQVASSSTAYVREGSIQKRNSFLSLDFFKSSILPLHSDAADLVRTIFGAVKYIHDCDIVHRDLKPENLLFRSKPEQTSEIMIADFGLSRVMADSKLNMLTEVCGTPGVRSLHCILFTLPHLGYSIWPLRSSRRVRPAFYFFLVAV